MVLGGEPDTVTAVGQTHLFSVDFQNPLQVMNISVRSQLSEIKKQMAEISSDVEKMNLSLSSQTLVEKTVLWQKCINNPKVSSAT